MRCTPSVQIRYALKPRFRKKTHLALHVHGGLSFQTSERTCAIKRSPKDNSRTIGLDAIIWHFQRIWTQTGWWTHNAECQIRHNNEDGPLYGHRYLSCNRINAERSDQLNSKCYISSLLHDSIAPVIHDTAATMIWNSFPSPTRSFQTPYSFRKDRKIHSFQSAFWAAVCKTVRPVLSDRCLSCL